MVMIGMLWLIAVPRAWADTPTGAAPPELNSNHNLDAFRRLAVQAGGRLKPFDSLAREQNRSITGSEGFGGQDAVANCLWWWANGPLTLDQPLVSERNLAFKKQLGLPADQRWFSVNQLQKNAALTRMRMDVMKSAQNGEKVPPQLSEARELLYRMRSLEMLVDGTEFNILPSPVSLMSPWGSFRDLDGLTNEPKAKPMQDTVAALRKAIVEHKFDQVAPLSTQLGQELQVLGPYPDQTNLDREVRYNAFHPFRWAWIFYLIGFLTLLMVPARLAFLGQAAIGCGFAMHLYGFFCRCKIAGRPPVTNMYESVIWVAFGAVLFALIFDLIYKQKAYLMAASGAAVICLVLADMLPAVLDPAIHPLTPVLRSNYWLVIHVLTITLGYAAFMLALGLGHIVVWKFTFQGDQREEIRALNKALYKAIQVGVLFLAAGTILGGVWANYSWGRFWGWDPKEVWALIALLGYLSILHGRYAGWLGNFGTAVCSILAFQGVIFAWYGVNFVLGAGLHSYGFGSGGVQYAAIYVGIELAFVIFASQRYRRRFTHSTEQ
jgi:cytochrome c-type biogenesis protein CcsB